MLHCNQEMQPGGDGRLRCDICGFRPRISGLEKSYARALNQSNGDHAIAAHLLGVSLREFTTNVSELKIDLYHRTPSKAKTYLVTSAQQSTPVFDKFMDTLELYKRENNAELIVIPFRYQNPTSIFSSTKERWWARRIVPYLCDTRFDITPHLTVMSDIKITPTAHDPLSMMEALSGSKSALFGHTSLGLKTVPVMSGEMPKILASTGCVTKRNYTDSKAGKKGEFHHTHSAQVIDVRGDIFHMRQINACADGSFIDLEYEYTRDGVYYADRPWLSLGDLHHFAMSKEATNGTAALIKQVDPIGLVWHDALDFYSRNHHHLKKVFINLAKHRAGVDDVRKELEALFKFLNKFGAGRQNVFPFSNHPAALARWIEESDWRHDPRNAEFYLETALAMVKSTKMQGHKSYTVDPFAYWGKQYMPDGVFLGPNESFEAYGIDMGNHGHIGANGARGGSVKSWAKLSKKTITGHGHGPGISHGAYRNGTLSVFDQEYVAGPSSWLHTNTLTYANGKRSLINLIGGKYK